MLLAKSSSTIFRCFRISFSADSRPPEYRIKDARVRYNGVAHVLRNGKGLAAESVHPWRRCMFISWSSGLPLSLDDQAVEALVQFGDPIRVPVFYRAEKIIMYPPEIVHCVPAAVLGHFPCGERFERVADLDGIPQLFLVLNKPHDGVCVRRLILRNERASARLYFHKPPCLKQTQRLAHRAPPDLQGLARTRNSVRQLHPGLYSFSRSFHGCFPRPD